MVRYFSLFIILVMMMSFASGCIKSAQDDSKSSGESNTVNPLDGVIANRITPVDEKIRKSIFTIGDATVYVLANNFEPMLPMCFELEETAVSVETVSGTLSSYVEEETIRDKRQSKFELSSSEVLYYDVHRTKLDYVKLTFFDDESIIGCALFAVECDDKIAYSSIIVAEFPEVDGKNQSITAEHVEAVFASVDKEEELASFKFAENIVAEQATIDRSGIYPKQVMLCGITVVGRSWSLASSALQGAPLKFTGIDKKVRAESANSNLLTYVSAGNGTWSVNESKKNFELSTDTTLYYSLANSEKEGFIDHIVVTVYDGDDIIGCAVFSVVMKNMCFFYIAEGAVEFPKVDGKNQRITSEIVKAYVESILN